MRLSIDRLSDYSLSLDSCADDAANQVTARLASRWQDVRGLDLKESVPIMREEATAALVNAENTFGVSSAAIGHNMLADMTGKNPEHGIEGMEVADEYADSQSARYWVKFIDGTEEGFRKFLDGVAGRARRNVSHAADREVAQAAAKMGMKVKGVRFARVPQGPSCGFCIMLASRGFVYATRKSAGEFTRFHDGCDCRVIAGIKGMDVEGYDPEGLYDRYVKCVKTINGGTSNSSNGQIYDDWETLSEEEQAEWGKKAKNGKDAFNNYFEHRVCQEMDTRDREWLWSGRPTPIDYSEKTRSQYGEIIDASLPLSRRYELGNITGKDNEKKDVFTHDMLSENGFFVGSRLMINQGGDENIDIDLNDHLCEVKSPEARPNASVKDELKFVYRDVQRARHQFQDRVNKQHKTDTPMRIVMSNYYTGFGAEREMEIFKRFRYEALRQGFAEALFIRKNGTVLRAI